MRAIAFLFPLLLGTTWPTAQELVSSFPDPVREHHVRFNCHNAYDYLAAEDDAGRRISADHMAHYKLAEGGKTCAPPPQDLATRVENRVISTVIGEQAAWQFVNRSKDASASSELGRAILAGTLKGHSQAEGLKQFRLAAERGDPDATFVVGSLYSGGAIGGKEDLVNAFVHFDRAANSGHVDAMYRRGMYYIYGYGVKANPALAFASLREAAGRGHIYASLMTILLLHEGTGTKQNFEQAYIYSRNLAAKGEPMGALFAGMSIGRTKTALKRKDEIFYWLDEASRMGNANMKNFVTRLREPIAELVRLDAADRAAARAAARTFAPRPWKSCPTKDYCTINHFTGVKSCNTVPDYTADCGMQ
jgi:uncharacterized protein